MLGPSISGTAPCWRAWWTMFLLSCTAVQLLRPLCAVATMLANNAQLQEKLIQRTRLFFRSALFKIGGNIAGGLTAPGLVFHDLRGNGVFWDSALARGASKHANKFIGGALHLVVGVPEVDEIDSFLVCLVCLLDVCCVRRWQSPNGFTCEKAKVLPIRLTKVPILHRIAVGKNFEPR